MAFATVLSPGIERILTTPANNLRLAETFIASKPERGLFGL
jgi:hypothetical protein